MRLAPGRLLWCGLFSQPLLRGLQRRDRPTPDKLTRQTLFRRPSALGSVEATGFWLFACGIWAVLGCSRLSKLDLRRVYRKPQALNLKGSENLDSCHSGSPYQDSQIRRAELEPSNLDRKNPRKSQTGASCSLKALRSFHKGLIFWFKWGVWAKGWGFGVQG